MILFPEVIHVQAFGEHIDQVNFQVGHELAQVRGEVHDAERLSEFLPGSFMPDLDELDARHLF